MSSTTNYNDSDSPCNTLPSPFSIAGQSHKLYQINGVFYVRNVDANTRQVIYSAASLDFYLNTLEEAGERLYRRWWASATLLRLIAALRPMPRMAAVHGRRAQATLPTPVSLIDVTFCQRCHEVIPDGDLCDGCDEEVERHTLTTSQKMQQQLLRDVPTAQTPNQAWQAKMDTWLAAHPLKNATAKTIACTDTPKEGVIKIPENKPVKLTKAQRAILERLADGCWGLDRYGAGYRFFNVANGSTDYWSHRITLAQRVKLYQLGLIASDDTTMTWQITDAGRKAVSS